jgi:hypothetical protein
MFPEAGGAVAPSAGGLLTSFSTSFLATENPISEGGIWLNGLADGEDWNDIETANGDAFGTAIQPGTFDDNIAILKNWGLADYYVFGIVHRGAGYNPSINHEVELFGRGKRTLGTPNLWRGYEILMSAHGNSEIVRWNGAVGSFQSIAQVGDQAVQDDDEILAVFSGTSITVFRNDIEINSATDATFADGAPGMGMFSAGGGSPAVVLANLGWKYFECGPL